MNPVNHKRCTGCHCRPMLQLPTGQSLQRERRRSWRTWTEQGAKQNERGKLMRRAVGKAWQRRAGTQSPLNKAAAGEHSRQMVCPAQALKQQQPPAGRPRSKTTAADDVGRPLAVQCRLMEGVRWCWPLRRRAQTYRIVCLPPTYHLCLSPSRPTPLI